MPLTPIEPGGNTTTPPRWYLGTTWNLASRLNDDEVNIGSSYCQRAWGNSTRGESTLCPRLRGIICHLGLSVDPAPVTRAPYSHLDTPLQEVLEDDEVSTSPLPDGLNGKDCEYRRSLNRPLGGLCTQLAEGSMADTRLSHRPPPVQHEKEKTTTKV